MRRRVGFLINRGVAELVAEGVKLCWKLVSIPFDCPPNTNEAGEAEGVPNAVGLWGVAKVSVLGVPKLKFDVDEAGCCCEPKLKLFNLFASCLTSFCEVAPNTIVDDCCCCCCCCWVGCVDPKLKAGLFKFFDLIDQIHLSYFQTCYLLYL